MKAIFITISVLIVFASCDEEVLSPESPQISHLVETRIQELYETRMTDCRNSGLRRAEAAVDSVLRSNPLKVLSDSIKAPNVPPRPGRPEWKKPTDTSMIRPIFKVDTTARG